MLNYHTHYDLTVLQYRCLEHVQIHHFNILINVARKALFIYIVQHSVVFIEYKLIGPALCVQFDYIAMCVYAALICCH